jgi:hypothetical protein
MKFRIATKSIATSRSPFLFFAWLIFAAGSPGQKTPPAAPAGFELRHLRAARAMARRRAHHRKSPGALPGKKAAR